MKTIIKRITKIFVFLALLTLAVYGCTSLLADKECKKKYYDFFNSNTNYDVIFLGTSHTWNHVLSMELWKDYGISSYNWGRANSSPAENYYIMREVYNYTSPKLIVFDVHGLVEYEANGNGKYICDRMEQRHAQFDALPLTKGKAEAIEDIFDNYDNRNEFYWNFIRYHNRWSELTESDFKYENYTEKGSYSLIGLGNTEYTPIEDPGTIELKSVCYDYLIKTLEYCSENNIQLLCTYLPYPARPYEQAIANSLKETIESYNGCRYLNMLTLDFLDYDTDIYTDNGHLNYLGAKKTTEWLGKYIRENYQVDDYSNNEYWIADYNEYYNYKKEELSSLSLLQDYLIFMSDPNFCGELELYIEDLVDIELLEKLAENADVTIKTSEPNEKYSAKLTIFSNKENTEISCISFDPVLNSSSLSSITKSKLRIIKPTNVKATAVDNKIVLTWTPSENATEYKILKYKDGQYTYLGTTQQTSFTVSSSRDTEYGFVVRAVCGKEISDYSDKDIVYTSLDIFRPDEGSSTIKEFNSNVSAVQSQAPYVFGLYEYAKGGYTWSTKDSCVIISNQDVASDGLNIKVMFTNWDYTKDSSLTVTVNGSSVKKIEITKEGNYNIRFDPSELEDNNGIYRVEFHASQDFNTQNIKYSTDDRNLSFKLMYIGNEEI